MRGFPVFKDVFKQVNGERKKNKLKLFRYFAISCAELNIR